MSGGNGYIGWKKSERSTIPGDGKGDHLHNPLHKRFVRFVVLSDHRDVCPWERHAHLFCFDDDGACLWQPESVFFERMSHFNVFLFPGILNRLRWSLSGKRLSLSAQWKPRLVSL